MSPTRGSLKHLVFSGSKSPRSRQSPDPTFISYSMYLKPDLHKLNRSLLSILKEGQSQGIRPYLPLIFKTLADVPHSILSLHNHK